MGGRSAALNITETGIAGVRVIESTVFKDDRGAFSRLFCARELGNLLGTKAIAQINHSVTRNVGAVRGLHYQHPPHAETKIVRCLKGRVFDVAVDLRQGSPTHLKWLAVELSPDNRRALMIPEGCAHGFQVMERDSELLYLHTAFYAPDAEGAVRFDDPRVAVAWPLTPTDVSKRDLSHPYLDENYKGIVL